jgi:hypothetical protein
MLTDRDSKLANSGQSVVEVVVAVSIFLIIAGASVITILGSFLSSKLAEGETTASLYAIEGQNAVVSIRNQSWSNLGNLTDGDYGLTETGGIWAFNASSDSLAGGYDRVTHISSVERNASGDIVDTGGTIDPNTKKVTTIVSWNFNPTQVSSVTFISYLTNWQGVSETGAGTTPTPTVTPLPTATPVPYASCSAFCAGNGYSTGTCRRNTNQCVQSGETNLPAGDQYCGSPPNTTCCCLP